MKQSKTESSPGINQMKNTFYFLFFLPVIIFLLAMQQQLPKKTEKVKKEELSTGKKLYEKYACNSCHGNDGIGQSDLRKAYKSYTDDKLQAYISNPRDFGNYRMPVYKDVIPATDYKALLAYVKYLGEKSQAAKKK